MESNSSLLIIGGTTASGKSELALRMAERLAERDGCVIVNADSVQLYEDLPILTARPGVDDEARCPHALYGVLAAHVPATAALWLERVLPLLARLRGEGIVPILVGGTGLYIHALLHGLAPVPPIPPEIRAGVRSIEPALLHETLAREDPVMAGRLECGDSQRLMRALEVIRATGRSLASWQDETRRHDLSGFDIRGVALLPDRALLRARIRERMARMIEMGALDEVRELCARVGDPLALPIAKAHGLRELIDLDRGLIDTDAAIDRTALRVGQYAKRQSTWFRNKLPELTPIETLGDSEEAMSMAIDRLVM